MRVVSLIACAATAFAGAPEFARWMTQYGKSYSGAEYQRRLAIFMEAEKEIADHKAALGEAAWKGLNEFSAMTKEEFAQSRLMKPFTADAVTCLANGVLLDTWSMPNIKAPPATWDWSKQAKPVVSPIQNQEQCGSCWAFSTVSAIESAWAISTGTLLKLSEQEIVDCSTACVLEDNQQVCNGGCNGGWPWSALTDVIKWKGLNTEASYPYTATTDTCATKPGVFAPVVNYTCLSGPNSGGPNYANETVMKAFSFSNGPLSIAMDATILQTYSAGIINPTAGECSKTQLDHAINIVGWGVSASGQAYWKVRNSWGTAWGEEGYFRIVFGKGACGLNAGVTFPIVSAK